MYILNFFIFETTKSITQCNKTQKNVVDLLLHFIKTFNYLGPAMLGTSIAIPEMALVAVASYVFFNLFQR